MKNKINIKVKVWIWPGDMPWHFVSLDPKVSEKVRKVFPKSPMIKCEVCIGKYKWNTSFFRNNRDKNYILPIKKKVRKDLAISAGDIVNLKIEY